VIAPIALIVCALAVFAIVSTSGEDLKPTENQSGDTKSQSSGSSESSGNDSGSDSTAGATAVVTRATYKVKPGDSFAAIAEKLNIDVDTLSELNPDVDARALQPGQKLKLR
jgi:LysM repeat protein